MPRGFDAVDEFEKVAVGVDDAEDDEPESLHIHRCCCVLATTAALNATRLVQRLILLLHEVDRLRSQTEKQPSVRVEKDDNRDTPLYFYINVKGRKC